jgi:hypothetical protein
MVIKGKTNEEQEETGRTWRKYFTALKKNRKRR